VDNPQYGYNKIPKVDIAIVDGVHRYECIEYAVNILKPDILIVDNWMQSFVFMCPSAEEILKPYKKEIFEQANHLDNDGINKWKTMIAYLK
jgi:hypothetical protein